MTSSPLPSSPEIAMFERHPTFYWDLITFEVENCLFRVPRNHFPMESDMFAGMFSLPPGESTNLEGSSDDHPIKLPPSISKNEFGNLLRVLYPTRSESENPYEDLAKEDWLPILRLSTMWEFRGIRQLAIRQLSDRKMLQPIEKVDLGLTFDVPDWLRDGVKELIQPESLIISPEDACRIGPTTLTKIYTAREELLRQLPAYESSYIYSDYGYNCIRTGCPMTHISTISQEQGRCIVEKVFEGELRNM